MDIAGFVYISFLLIGTVIYWIVPVRHQWAILLLMSMFFFCTYVEPLIFIYVIISTATVYLATMYIEKKDTVGKWVVISTIVVNIGILAILKYTNLFINTANYIGQSATSDFKEINTISWIAPLGISFYTLQIISYLIDCSGGMIKAEKNPFKLLLFTCYFPQMVSGPISRYSELGEQLYEDHHFDYDRVTKGLVRIAFGIMKKVAVGNRLLILVNILDGDKVTYGGMYVWMSAILYTTYLYVDFSGCMDIIIGSSFVIGIELPENFNAPFFARSVQDFWRKWHVTLGAWLRDYIMNPLAIREINWRMKRNPAGKGKSNRRAKVKPYLSMLVVWFCMGLWHGNSWKYIIGEGLWFWIIIALGLKLEPLSKRCIDIFRINEKSGVWHAFQSIRTFILFAFGMIFFKSDGMPDAISTIVTGFTTKGNISDLSKLPYVNSNMGGTFGLVCIIIGLVIVICSDIIVYKGYKVSDVLAGRNTIIRWLIYLLIIALIMTSLNVDSAPFTYAEF